MLWTNAAGGDRRALVRRIEIDDPGIEVIFRVPSLDGPAGPPTLTKTNASWHHCSGVRERSSRLHRLHAQKIAKFICLAMLDAWIIDQIHMIQPSITTHRSRALISIRRPRPTRPQYIWPAPQSNKDRSSATPGDFGPNGEPSSSAIIAGGLIVFVTWTTVAPAAAEIGGGAGTAWAGRKICAILTSSPARTHLSDPASMTWDAPVDPALLCKAVQLMASVWSVNVYTMLPVRAFSGHRSSNVGGVDGVRN